MKRCEKEYYDTPEIEVVEIEVEKGFAGFGEGEDALGGGGL